MCSRVIGVLLACAVTSATAQTLPAGPVTLGGGRVVISVDAAVAIAAKDAAFFNYSDYEHSTLREFRGGLSTLVRATDRVALLGEFRSENLERHNVPPGTYTVSAWHEGETRDTHSVTIPPQGGPMDMDFVVQ